MLVVEAVAAAVVGAEVAMVGKAVVVVGAVTVEALRTAAKITRTGWVVLVATAVDAEAVGADVGASGKLARLFLGLPDLKGVRPSLRFQSACCN